MKGFKIKPAVNGTALNDDGRSARAIPSNTIKRA